MSISCGVQILKIVDFLIKAFPDVKVLERRAGEEIFDKRDQNAGKGHVWRF